MSEERKRIMKAALDEFVEVGIVDSSLESIADRAGLKLGVVRALFVDKEILLGELLKEETEPMVCAMAVVVQESKDPKELMRKSMQLLDQWFLAHPKVTRLYLHCFLSREGAVQSIYQRSLLRSEFYERLKLIIDRGQVRCKDVFILSLLLDSLITFLHFMRPTIELMCPEQTVEQIAERRLEAVIDLFENGLYSE